MISIIMPTYNEAYNIKKIIPRINRALGALEIDYEIIIIDDNSPDGTADIAESIAEKYSVKVIRRKSKLGLSSAVLKGFNIAKGNILGVMDADLSHPPEILPKLIEPITDGRAEITTGTKYAKGGKVKNWPIKRIIVSKVASILARPLTSVSDPTSGFFFMKKEVIKGAKLTPKGYKIFLEVLVKGKYKNIEEVPYTFIDRKFGKSKFNLSEVKNYLLHLLSLYFYKVFH